MWRASKGSLKITKEAYDRYKEQMMGLAFKNVKTVGELYKRKL